MYNCTKALFMYIDPKNSQAYSFTLTTQNGIEYKSGRNLFY